MKKPTPFDPPGPIPLPEGAHIFTSSDPKNPKSSEKSSDVAFAGLYRDDYVSMSGFVIENDRSSTKNNVRIKDSESEKILVEK
jgi:hypothetical protein